jgi:hypothetical protein
MSYTRRASFHGLQASSRLCGISSPNAFSMSTSCVDGYRVIVVDRNGGEHAPGAPLLHDRRRRPALEAAWRIAADGLRTWRKDEYPD